jgi:hypothetical protein
MIRQSSETRRPDPRDERGVLLDDKKQSIRRCSRDGVFWLHDRGKLGPDLHKGVVSSGAG